MSHFTAEKHRLRPNTHTCTRLICLFSSFHCERRMNQNDSLCNNGCSVLENAFHTILHILFAFSLVQNIRKVITCLPTTLLLWSYMWIMICVKKNGNGKWSDNWCISFYVQCALDKFTNMTTFFLRMVGCSVCLCVWSYILRPKEVCQCSPQEHAQHTVHGTLERWKAFDEIALNLLNG